MSHKRQEPNTYNKKNYKDITFFAATFVTGNTVKSLVRQDCECMFNVEVEPNAINHFNTRNVTQKATKILLKQTDTREYVKKKPL